MTRASLLILLSAFLVMALVESTTYGVPKNPWTDAGPAPHLFGPTVTAFALDVLKTLSKTETGNTLFSPSSLYKTLLTVYLGSSGAGKDNLARTLHLDSAFFDVTRNFEIWRQMRTSIVREGERLFYDQDNNIKEEFKELLQDYIQGLSPKAAESKEAINNWATDTMGYKNTIVKGKDLHSLKLLPISLAFSKYNLKNTLEYIIPTNMHFYSSADESESVPSMDRLDHFKYFEDSSLQTKILSIQYRKTQWSFIMLLPDEGQTVTQLIDSLTFNKITNILQNLKDKKIVLQMPQIRTEQIHSITSMCETFQICDLLKDNNDLQGMTTDSGFFINDFIHKVGFQLFAEVEVPVPQPWYSGVDFFTAKRPFVYMVYDNEANMPMILGTMMNPKQ